MIPLKKRQSTDHLPHKIQHLRITPTLLVPLIHHILKRVLMVLEQRMQFEQVRADAKIIFHPEMAKGDEVAIAEGLPRLHLLGDQLRVELEDGLLEGELLLGLLVLDYGYLCAVEVGDEAPDEPVLLVQPEGRHARIR